jgi:guanine deaminase
MTDRDGVIVPGTPLDYLELAVASAAANVEDGGGPFGAILALADGRFYVGTNGVTRYSDPTAHAEVTAIRRASSMLRSFDLAPFEPTLYTSCYPCPMCLAAALWAHIPKIVYAADPLDAQRAGFDDRLFYTTVSMVEASLPSEHRPARFERLKNVGDHESIIAIEQDRRDDRLGPFLAWAANDDRTDY